MVISMSKSIAFVVVLVAIVTTNQATAQPPTEPTYFTEVCRISMGNYTTNSTYEANLMTLLTNLYAESSTASFSNASVGSASSVQAFGQYYCRSDINSSLCSDCIKEAAQTIFVNCHNFKSAVVWYEECTLRYDDVSVVGVVEDRPRMRAYSDGNVTDPDEVSPVVIMTMARLINQSAYGDSSSSYATGEVVVSQFETAYCLVQCSPDIHGTHCDTCLHSAYDYIPNWWPQTWMIFYPGCQLRYSTLGAFYNPQNAPPPEAAAPTSVTTPSPPTGKSAGLYITIAAVIAAAGILILLALWFCLIKRRRFTKIALLKKKKRDFIDVENGVGSSDCFEFDLDMIKDATDGFSSSNKLGEGGFGIVYRGVLENGQQIAVKRLSENSGQGAQEFKTEVAVVAKLQHKNLVRLVGYCVEEEEQLLVYEFMPNLSLERFLFDSTNSAVLTWEVRTKIMIGIASGLHYLHEDSRVKIVHRDLKTSNILLDDDLGPKIADFGLARLVKLDQTSANTVRVVGTYGYMAPEYALAGRFSTKSDVYSYGVMVLEILSGKSNSKFYETTHGEGLLRNAWRIWNEGGVEQFMDSSLEKKYSKDEAQRYLQIGLLCVQDDDLSRPTMHAVLVMFNHSSELPTPFFPSLVSKNMPHFDDNDSRITTTTNQQSD